MSEEAVAKAREQARLGRLAQLKVLEDFEAGKEVKVVVHNNPAGYAISKDKLTPTPRTSTRIKFPPLEVLMDLTARGDADGVEKALKEGADPKARNADGLTPLHKACIENTLNCATLLMQFGADVNAQDDDLWTPLHAAAEASNWRAINFLTANGADVTAVNADGDLPLDLVTDPKVEKILQREMEQKGVTEAAVPALRAATEQRMLQDMQQLVARGGDVNAPQAHGATYLHVAACNGYTPVVLFLLAQPGIAVNAQDADGNTPLHLAAFFQHYEVVMHLVTNGASLAARNRDRQKPIVLSEDTTMIHILASLERKTLAPAAAAADAAAAAAAAGSGGDPAVHLHQGGGTVGRSNTAKRQAAAKRDQHAEHETLAHAPPTPAE